MYFDSGKYCNIFQQCCQFPPKTRHLPSPEDKTHPSATPRRLTNANYLPKVLDPGPTNCNVFPHCFMKFCFVIYTVYFAGMIMQPLLNVVTVCSPNQSDILLSWRGQYTTIHNLFIELKFKCQQKLGMVCNSDILTIWHLRNVLQDVNCLLG